MDPDNNGEKENYRDKRPSVGIASEKLVIWMHNNLRKGTCSIQDGEVRSIFFGLKIYALGIFLGQEICHVFFFRSSSMHD